MCFDFLFCHCWSTVLYCRVAKGTSQFDHSRNSLSATLPRPENFTAGTEAFPKGQVQCPPWLSTHPILTWSGQVSLPHRPHTSQVTVSNVLFHKAVYSRCSNTETATAGASEKGPPTKEPLGFCSLSLSTPKSPSFEFLLRVPQCPFTWLAPPSSCPLLTKGLAVYSLLSL